MTCCVSRRGAAHAKRLCFEAEAVAVGSADLTRLSSSYFAEIAASPLIKSPDSLGQSSTGCLARSLGSNHCCSGPLN